MNKPLVTLGCSVGFLALAGIAGMTATARPASAAQEAGSDAPASLELTGIVRDFRQRSGENGYSGHTDFERRPTAGFGLYCGNVDEYLDEEGKPVFVGGGNKITSQWKDSSNRNICYRLYDAARGDVAGTKGAADPGGITSAESFAQWFRDVPGMNMSMPLSLTFVRQMDGTYVFNDRTDEHYTPLGGFFPLEDQLFGNPGGSPDRNFHFTFELHTEFTYEADGEQVFQFIGDDDVWVFINGRMVIDLGGVHGATNQYVDLNRLGLEDGETYALDFFFAERHRTQSNFRIVTNLRLENVTLPTVSQAFD